MKLNEIKKHMENWKQLSDHGYLEIAQSFPLNGCEIRVSSQPVGFQLQ